MKKNIPNINYTLHNDLCTGCGNCQGVCPSNAISFGVNNGRFLPLIDVAKCNNIKGCHRCYDLCPGLGIDLCGFAKNDFVDDNVKIDRFVGRYIKCYSGYSRDYEIRYHSASGGVVTQFLIWLLENKLIDGAVVTKFDSMSSLLVKTFIATTKDDIISARSSKYSPVSFYNVINDIKKSSLSRVVVVGIPCHIHGIRKAMEHDRLLREKVTGLFAIYCSSGRTFYMTDYIFKQYSIDKSKLNFFAYRDEGCLGSMHIVEGERIVKRKFEEYYRPLRSFFVPRRCLLCIDHYGELGDLCFGDIHVEPYDKDTVGVSSIIARSSKWMQLLEEANTSGALALNEISIDVVNASQKMSKVKKERNERYVDLYKKIGFVVPLYDETNMAKSNIMTVVSLVQNRIQQFIGSHRSLWFLIRCLKYKS